MRLSKILNLILYVSVFLFSIYPYSDYDWGWHYRYGEYLLKTGSLLKSDIFSWTLPDYQWINHSWLYDPLMYIIFKLGGFTGAMIVGALISFLVFYLSTKFFNLQLWQKALMALFFITITQIVMLQSLRSQVLVLLFYPILTLLLIFSKKNTKFLFFLPLLFLIWANFHGTFTIGLLVAALFIGTAFLIDYEKEKKNFFIYSGIFLVTFIATLITPYGNSTYFEAFKHLSSPWTKNVFEWMPFFVFVKNSARYYFVFYLILLTSFFIYRRKLTDLPFAVALSVLTLLTINSNRYAGPFIATSLPVLGLFLHETKIPLEKFKVVNLILATALIVSLEIGWQRVTDFNWLKFSFNDYCRYSTRCSEKMSRYLFDNPPRGKGLNFYDWGGYLIGRGIPVKLFIDGRMHLWEKDGYMPFADFIKMYYEQDYELFRKYNFDWLLLRTDSPLVQDLKTPNILLGTWEKVFSDGEAVYFIKK